MRSSSRHQPLHQQPQLVSKKELAQIIYKSYLFGLSVLQRTIRLPHQLQQNQQQQRLGMIGDSPESAAAAAVAAASTGDVEVAVDAVLTAAGSPVQQASVKAARMKSKTARRLSNAQQVKN